MRSYITTISIISVMLGLIETVPLVHYQDVLDSPHHYQQHQEALEDPQHFVEEARPVHQKKWDKWGMGFGSDGYLYDFVKRAPKYSSPKFFDMGSDGYLYDFVKRAPRSRGYGPGYRKYNYGFGSDGYLYDFVKK